jgi:hypothetical protein
MADQLYLSLWYSNFRFANLPVALERVLGVIGDRVKAATVYPLSWNESPVYQRVYDDKDPAETAQPAAVVRAATEHLHEDYAYEFEMPWELWIAEREGDLEPIWKKEPRVIRVTGFGPEFDEGSFEQNGQVRIDLGSDTPFLQEDLDLDEQTARYVQQNVLQLIELTSAIQQNGGAATRLLWSETGENLAQKLIARLQQLN